MLPQVEPDYGAAAGTRCDGHDRIAVGEGEGQRLLDEEVLPGFEHSNSVAHMLRGRCAHSNGVDCRVGKQAGDVSLATGARDHTRGCRASGFVHVAERNDVDLGHAPQAAKVKLGCRAAAPNER